MISLFDRDAEFMRLKAEADREIAEAFRIPQWMLYGAMKPVRMETAVLDPAATLPDVEAPAAPTKPEEKEDIEDIERRARKPPADGPCKGCGQEKPLNRLFLCHPCWTRKNLEAWAKDSKGEWIHGDPHPSFCGCNLPEHNGIGSRSAPGCGNN